MESFYLTPANGTKSFRNKCYIRINTNKFDDEISYLISNHTHVASYNHNTKIMTIKGYLSLATRNHINAFLKYHGFDQCTKQEMEKYYEK